MSKVTEIQAAIHQLPREEFWKLGEWFDEKRAKEWDEQLDADAKTGRLDTLWERAKEEIG